MANDANNIPTQKGLRVLMISGDPKALSTESGVYKRLLLQAAQVDWLEVFVRGESIDTPLGDQGIVRGFAGSKFAVAREMVNLALQEKFDVITTQDPFFLGLIGWRIAQKIGTRLQLQMHTDIFSSAFSGFSRKLLAKYLLRRADSVRVVSEHIRQSLERLHLCARVSVLPVFIDEDAIRGAVAVDLKRIYPQFSQIVLVAARLEREKHVDAIIRAMPKIVVAFPRVGFLIAGSGSQKEVLIALTHHLGIAKQVIFLGHRDDVFSLYKESDCVIAATAPYEGYGAGTVEALAAGAPVVSADVGVAREAGAIIVKSRHYSEAVIRVLENETRGVLQFQLPSAEEWARQWHDTL